MKKYKGCAHCRGDGIDRPKHDEMCRRCAGYTMSAARDRLSAADREACDHLLDITVDMLLRR